MFKASENVQTVNFVFQTYLKPKLSSINCLTSVLFIWRLLFLSAMSILKTLLFFWRPFYLSGVLFYTPSVLFTWRPFYISIVLPIYLSSVLFICHLFYLSTVSFIFWGPHYFSSVLSILL